VFLGPVTSRDAIHAEAVPEDRDSSPRIFAVVSFAAANRQFAVEATDWHFAHALDDIAYGIASSIRRQHPCCSRWSKWRLREVQAGGSVE